MSEPETILLDPESAQSQKQRHLIVGLQCIVENVSLYDASVTTLKHSPETKLNRDVLSELRDRVK